MHRAGDSAGRREIVGEVTGHLSAGEVLRQAEVEQLRNPAVGQEDVARRDVAVHHALVVGGAERTRHLAGNRQDLVEGQRPGGEAGLQAAALEQLHRDERLALALVDFENGADIRMVERRGQARLPLESQDRLGVSGKRGLQELERHRSRQPRILRLVDDAHAAAAKDADHIKVRDVAADHDVTVARVEWRCPVGDERL